MTKTARSPNPSRESDIGSEAANREGRALAMRHAES